MKKNLIIVYNYPLHYREPIFCEIENSFNVEWFFGDKLLGIKKMDTSKLRNCKELKTINLFRSRFTWTKGIINFKTIKSKNLLLFGDLNSISSALLLFLRKILFRQTVIWTHGAYGKESLILILFKLLYFSMASIILTYNERSCKIIRSWGYKKSIFPIYNSLGKKIKHIPKIQRKKNSCNILYLGRVTDIKKLEILVMAYKKIVKNFPFVKLRIVGDNVLKSNKLNFKIEDPLYDEKKVSSLFNWADVTVSPGNIGLLALNSIRNGTPIISHNNWDNQMPEYEILVEGINGFSFNENDADDLADVIVNNFIKSNFKIKDSFLEEYNKKWNTENQIKILENLFN